MATANVNNLSTVLPPGALPAPEPVGSPNKGHFNIQVSGETQGSRHSSKDPALVLSNIVPQDPRHSGGPGGSPRKSAQSSKSSTGIKVKKLGCQQLMRLALSNSTWYKSKPAQIMRQFVKGKVFGFIMMIALVVALFLPDTWVLIGINSNTGINIMLFTVMVLFAAEFLMQTATDAGYMFSFFFLMDIVGTVSMVFDISWTFAEADHTVPMELSEDGANTENLMLLRAARAAKIGARAGRLTRVLRVLKYLPFLTGNAGDAEKASEDKGGIASMISAKLNNVVGTRVACLTIVLVMVIPLFDLWTFPEQDNSLLTWVQRLNENYQDNRVNDTMAELQVMVDFYAKKDYGPYWACLGTVASDGFACFSNGTLSKWQPLQAQPPRLASTTRVIAGNTMVDFNMYGPDQVKAGLSMATVFFIIFMMVFSGLALSNVVTAIAVRPLERVLNLVKNIASTVFKFSDKVNEANEFEDVEEFEDLDVDTSSEMKLLEKVVHKLAKIAELQGNKDVEVNEDMGEEEMGVLNMMQGTRTPVNRSRNSDKRAGSKKVAAVSIKLVEDCGITEEAFDSWDFNPLPLNNTQRCKLVMFTITKFHQESDAFVTSIEEEARLNTFVSALEKEYANVPFHNFAHAVDVCHGVNKILHLINSNKFLSDLEQFALLIAAVGHDVGHPGVNNGFLSEVGHELALQYNDRSPLENMHCAKLYTIVANAEHNVFGSLSKDQYRECRKMVIEAILHTDMMSHFGMVKDLQLLYQMNSDTFIADGTMSEAQQLDRENEVFGQADNKLLLMNFVLHSADVSNPCRSWEVTYAWAQCCLEEFFAQGDQEKMLGVPVQFLNDRDKLNRPNSQIGFIEFMIAPFFAAQIKLFHALHEFGDNLANNLQEWEKAWVAEVGPGDEEKQKVRGRVERIDNMMENAKNRVEQ